MPGYEAWQRMCRQKRTRPTPGEVAVALGVTLKTVRSWEARGWLTVSYDYEWAADHSLRRKVGPGRIRLRAVKRLLQRPAVQLVVARAMARHQSIES